MSRFGAWKLILEYRIPCLPASAFERWQQMECRSHEDRPLFEADYYESKDYSKDGEVMTLQKATNGKGIDLVFMGDGYTDKDMAPGGLQNKKNPASESPQGF